MPLPNFLIIGAGRTGTTSLYYYLRQHPEIFMPDIKEPRFFLYEGMSREKIRGKEEWKKSAITDIDAYRALFAEVTNEKAYGEASVEYFYHPTACKKIKQYLPNVKLIVGLRHPLERVYSHYLFCIRYGIETEHNFFKALLADMRSPKIGYIGGGLYYKFLRPYIRMFGKERIFIYLYEDFKNYTLPVLRNIFEFLQVSSDFTPDISEIHNITVQSGDRYKKVTKGESINYYPLIEGPHFFGSFIERILPPKIRKNIIESLSMSKAIPNARFLEDLITLYQKDTKRLEVLINRDLSHWMKWDV